MFENFKVGSTASLRWALRLVVLIRHYQPKIKSVNIFVNRPTIIESRNTSNPSDGLNILTTILTLVFITFNLVLMLIYFNTHTLRYDFYLRFISFIWSSSVTHLE